MVARLCIIFIQHLSLPASIPFSICVGRPSQTYSITENPKCRTRLASVVFSADLILETIFCLMSYTAQYVHYPTLSKGYYLYYYSLHRRLRRKKASSWYLHLLTQLPHCSLTHSLIHPLLHSEPGRTNRQPCPPCGLTSMTREATWLETRLMPTPAKARRRGRGRETWERSRTLAAFAATRGQAE